jgi:hypothetical protein
VLFFITWALLLAAIFVLKQFMQERFYALRIGNIHALRPGLGSAVLLLLLLLLLFCLMMHRLINSSPKNTAKIAFSKLDNQHTLLADHIGVGYAACHAKISRQRNKASS